MRRRRVEALELERALATVADGGYAAALLAVTDPGTPALYLPGPECGAPPSLAAELPRRDAGAEAAQRWADGVVAWLNQLDEVDGPLLVTGPRVERTRAVAAALAELTGADPDDAWRAGALKVDDLVHDALVASAGTLTRSQVERAAARAAREGAPAEEPEPEGPGI